MSAPRRLGPLVLDPVHVQAAVGILEAMQISMAIVLQSDDVDKVEDASLRFHECAGVLAALIDDRLHGTAVVPGGVL